MIVDDLAQAWAPLQLTLKVAAVSSLVLLLIATPLAWALSRWRSRWKILMEALIALPLVLPPTVLGFYLLIVLHPHGQLSQGLQALGLDVQLSFSFVGLVIASIIYSLPFAVQPLISAFEAVPERLLNVAASLRAGPWDRFVHVVVPLSRRGFITAAVLSFAHTVGEFGVVLMVGGNIPGETRMVSMAIYDHVEAVNYPAAHALSLVMLVFALLTLCTVYALNRKLEQRL